MFSSLVEAGISLKYCTGDLPGPIKGQSISYKI